MHRRVIFALSAILAMGFAGLGSNAAQAQNNLDFAMVNRTGYQIDEVYVGPTTSRSWGNDVLGENTLEDAKSVNIRFNRNTATCHWDIKVVYNDGDESEFRSVNLCSISRVTLYWNRKAGTTRFVTE